MRQREMENEGLRCSMSEGESQDRGGGRVGVGGTYC
jgi:hypothetical protein